MVELETETDRRDGVTLVRGLVTNTRTTRQLIRLSSRLDGPTWPPRRDGARPAEWTDGCWEGVVEPGRRRGFGFATPTEPTAEPVKLVTARRPDDGERQVPEAVLAGLEDHAPSRRTVGTPTDG
ncbi:DUF7857 domain-containing protein [Natrialba swarupiae]|uniref:Uncharacterized protein n=1 Tax=Natrialba swarupiae TaxID=2448032 RepID=A0A5D5AN02_9EURY|nr:hypothetical protein [Natrialba swarupiae]TYT63219.1 hypothetical protein FYC77_03865 [Natrialba swarupiae]